MKKLAQPIDIRETNQIRNKIPNEKILHMALMLGMIPLEEYNYLKAIGESKHVDELMRELSILELDTLVAGLKHLLHDQLIEIS
ncbi:MAG TPA: hypothetical protein VKM55_02560 [Candidatus Lokiarchaeia archaeon]|nr:hypothetical protein [Candidatus Lokiarchaeia archaeon]